MCLVCRWSLVTLAHRCRVRALGPVCVWSAACCACPPLPCTGALGVAAHSGILLLTQDLRLLCLDACTAHRYMTSALFGISMESMNSPEEQVSLQGIEFWSAICDEEAELDEEMQEIQQKGGTPKADQICKYYAQGAHTHLLPILLTLMEKQDEHDDADEWNVSKAAHVCLNLMTEAVKTDVLNVRNPFRVVIHLLLESATLHISAHFAMGWCCCADTMHGLILILCMPGTCRLSFRTCKETWATRSGRRETLRCKPLGLCWPAQMKLSSSRW